MRLEFLWIGETRDPRIHQIEEEYLERITRFLPVQRQWVAELKKSDARQQVAQLKREARLVRKKLKRGSWLVALDERGREFSSRQFAAWLERMIGNNVPAVTFLVGGHLGIPESLKQSADFQLSVSRLTLPHELTRVVLLEQVYRALSLSRGLPYHK